MKLRRDFVEMILVPEEEGEIHETGRFNSRFLSIFIIKPILRESGTL